MASVVFDPRRGIYYVQWHNGTRRTRTPVYRLNRWKKGDARPARDPLQVDQAKADYGRREKAARLRGASRDPASTVADFLAAYRAGYAGRRAAASLEQLDRAVATFLAWCEGEGASRLDRVTPAACRRFLEARAGQGVAWSTLRKERALLAAAWAQAVRLEEWAANPWVNVPVPARERKAKKGSWSPEEFERLLKAARPWLRDLLVVGAHTGIRISALLGLEWRDVHWGEGGGPGLGRVEVRPELDKAGRGYHVPLHPRVHDVLARRLVHREGDRVLTGQAGRPKTSGQTFKAIHSACRRAGLGRPSACNHMLRRTFGRWAVLGHLTGKPVPLYVAARWMGHSSVKVTEIYLDLKPDESADWMAGSGEGVE